MSPKQDPPKRKAGEIALPDRGEDPAERKRVLNVLAQRRYRQKRREHLKHLEAQAGGKKGVESPTDQEDSQTQSEASISISDSDADTVHPLTVPESIFQDFQPDQSQLFEDPFSAFDPNFVAFPSDLQSDWNMQLPSLPNSPLSSEATSSRSRTPISSPSTSLSTIDNCSFPDEAYLEVLELKLMQGAVSIARRLDIQDLIWSLESSSPFADPSMALANFQHLPPNLRPTMAQMSQPHHPVLDLLPWPSVRNRLIMVFSQPADMRPKCAASPTAMVELVYDIEDSHEGVRIWGDDPYSEQAWEVGEKVFKNWWWAFDGDVIRRSNELRKNRGAKLLGMGQGSVLGEVA